MNYEFDEWTFEQNLETDSKLWVKTIKNTTKKWAKFVFVTSYKNNSAGGIVNAPSEWIIE